MMAESVIGAARCWRVYPGGLIVRFISKRHGSQLIKRLTSSSSTSVKGGSNAVNDIRRVGIPLVPKNRDTNAVLKALATTVDISAEETPFMGRSDADPYSPRRRRQMLDYLMAQEAGKRTGEYIINNYPKFFPGRLSEPDRSSWRPKWKGLNEESLHDYIKARKLSKVQEIYKELENKGHKISLESQNGVLALLAYLGTGNTPTPSKAMPTALDDRTDTIDGKDNEQELVTLKDMKPRRKLVPIRTSWSLENEAEQMFASMSERDGGTYGALIQGLAKFGEYSRAFELFEEARKKDLQLSLTTYNRLLSALVDSNETKQWEKAKKIASNMNQQPVVRPDISTINFLLMFAYGTGGNARQNSMEVIREMTYLGLKPTLTTFLRLLDCFMTNKDNSILYPVVDYLEKHSSEVLNISEYSDVDFFPFAMLGVRWIRDASLAKRLNNLAKKDQWYLVGTPETFLSHYLFVSSFEMNIAEFYQEYKQIVPRLFVPKEWVYLMMFKKCESEQRPDLAVTLWQDMMKYRVMISDMDVINRLMGAFTRPFNPEDIGQYIEAIKYVWNKLSYMDEKPSALVLSVTIKMYTLDNKMDEARKYFDMFKQYNIKPSFLAVHALLKAYYRLSDRDNVIECLDIMVDNKFFLPLTFVRDVCHKVGVPNAKRASLLKEFERNKPSGAAKTTTFRDADFSD